MLERHKYDVMKVIKHKDWDGSGYTFPDLALIKLAKQVKFRKDESGKNSIAPICLSNKNIKAGAFDSEAFVAGK